MIEKLLEKYYSAKIGFHETMSGVCYEIENSIIHPEDYDKEPLFEFTVTASAPMHRFLNRKDEDFMLTKIDGIVTMYNICKDAKIHDGTLLLDFFGNQQLVYNFWFRPDNPKDNRTFEYYGTKNLSAYQPVESMTTLGGQIIADIDDDVKNEYISICEFNLNLKTLKEFMLSFLKNSKIL